MYQRPKINAKVKNSHKKIDINLYDLGLDNGFLGITPKPEARKNR